METKKRVALITGASGQDGSYMIEHLTRQGVKTYACMRRSSRDNCALDHPSFEPVEEHLEFRHLELTDSTSVNKIFQELGSQITEVYHLGAFTHVGQSASAPTICIQTNTIGTLNMLEALRVYAPDAVFYNAVTSELFDGLDAPQNEESDFGPRTPYAVSKMSTYWLCKFYAREHGLKIKQGILFNHESPRRGKDFVTQKVAREFVKIRLDIENNRDWKKFPIGNLDAARDWGHAEDYVKAIERIALSETEQDVFVVGTGKCVTVRDLCELAMKSVGLEGKIEDYLYVDPRFVRKSEVWTLQSDPTLINEVLKWYPEYSFEELIFEMVGWQIKLQSK